MERSADQVRIERDWIQAAAERDAHRVAARVAKREGRLDDAAAERNQAMETHERCKVLEAAFRALEKIDAMGGIADRSDR